LKIDRIKSYPFFKRIALDCRQTVFSVADSNPQGGLRPPEENRRPQALQSNGLQSIRSNSKLIKSCKREARQILMKGWR